MHLSLDHGRPRVSTLVAACLLVLAATGPALADHPAVLGVGAAGERPVWRVISRTAESLSLEITIPAIAVEDVTVGSETYQVLTLPEGGDGGRVGEPLVPTAGGLIALPAEVACEIRATVLDESEYDAFRLVPRQDENDPEFRLDPAAYARNDFAGAPLAVLSPPAILGALRVASIVVSPVRYNPVEGRVRVASRIGVEVTFHGGDPVNPRPTRGEFIPRSFDRIYRELVVNYEGEREKSALGDGTYLVICPDDPEVVSRLQPLLDWRRREGIPVRLATTAETGTSAEQIKAYIQGAYENWPIPPEYVALVGDVSGSSISLPTWFENLSGYGGEGDHPYSTLAGNDILSDVHLGRLSVASYAELEIVVAKTVAYESAPYVADPTWFTRACLVGDPTSSGYSTIIVQQWIKTRLRQLGYAQIDTVFSAPFVSQMAAALNRGDSIFCYRGFYGFSGWGNGNTYALTNVNKPCFGVMSTCGTGSFAYGTSNSEAFLRAGTVAQPKAGIGAIGTATTGTHTRFNNCYTYGVFQGLLYEGLQEMGAAHTRGKIELYRQYRIGDPAYAEIFSYWDNLMGDPAVPVWTAFPTPLTVLHPGSLEIGTNSILVEVRESSGDPCPEARVCVLRADGIASTGWTDAAGRVELPLELSAAGTLKLTVTHVNRQPYLTNVPVGTPLVHVGFDAGTVDDDAAGGSLGNGNAIPNPGERIEFPVRLRNSGSAGAAAGTATLTTADPYITLLDASEEFDAIPAGGTTWTIEDFDFEISPACPHDHALRLGLEVVSGTESWHSLIELSISSFDVRAGTPTLYGSGNGQLDPGENLELSVPLQNLGGLSATNLVAVLSTEDPWITVLDSTGTFGSIAPAGSGENTADRFRLSADAGTFEGHLANLRLIATAAGDVCDTTWIQIPVGTRTSVDPVGPDAYGYYAFDGSDVEYTEAPTYSWVEIDPTLGGPGTQVVLGDYGDYQDKSRGIDLPFLFQFYGEPFTRATICSNGWIAMGDTYLFNYRNWSIPGAGCPQNMIAVYWDDLMETSTGHVYTWYDAAQHRFVVEWSRLHNTVGNHTEIFEVILYDPAYHLTPSGDGIILMQYSAVISTDSVDGYATVGIQNADHTDGLLYTYYNAYAPGAATLGSGRAIRFLPVTAQPQGIVTGIVHNASYGDAPLAGAAVRLLDTPRTFASGEDGLYFGSAPAGTYTLVCSRTGFEPDTTAAVQITAQQTTMVDFALVDVGGPEFGMVGYPEAVQNPNDPLPVTAEISDPSAIGSAELTWRTNGGGWTTLPMSAQGDGTYLGLIPPQPVGSTVEFYLRAFDSLGHASVEPAGAPAELLQIVVTLVLFADDAESEGGWILSQPSDASQGRWVRADPPGTWSGLVAIEPEDDHTPAPGTACFVTGVSVGGTPDQSDVDGGCVTLTSPVLDLGNVQTAILSYWRWFVNYGADGGFLDVHASNDNGAHWHLIEELWGVAANAWTEHSCNLGEIVPLTSQFRVRFVACDIGSESLVEAAIDDLRIDGVPLVTAAPEPSAPAVFRLDRVEPNPCRDRATLRFSLPSAGAARLTLFDVQGRVVRRLLDGPIGAGNHAVTWDGRDDRGRPAPAGLYLYQLEAGGRDATQRLLRLE